uniref:Beta-N-acetylhexosaminidase n=1 Tax=Ascaris lumbricoides TaxID=6252 RepID=A0A0M3HHB6_ASCLU
MEAHKRGRQALILDREDGIGALIASEKLALPSFYDGWTAPERSDIDTYKRLVLM